MAKSGKDLYEEAKKSRELDLPLPSGVTWQPYTYPYFFRLNNDGSMDPLIDETPKPVEVATTAVPSTAGTTEKTR
jgi:hypothetical protein